MHGLQPLDTSRDVGLAVSPDIDYVRSGSLSNHQSGRARFAEVGDQLILEKDLMGHVSTPQSRNLRRNKGNGLAGCYNPLQAQLMERATEAWSIVTADFVDHRWD